jgi:heptosyltransferase III
MKAPRFLVLRGGAIGDFVCTLPVVAALRRQWPHAYIEWLGYPHMAALALDAGLVDRVESLDQAEVAQYFSLQPRVSVSRIERLRSFDMVISYLYDPSGTVKQNLLSLGVRQVITCSPQVRERHAVDHLFRALEALAIYPEGAEYPRLALAAAGVREGGERVRHYGARVLAIHPGSGSLLKNWPLARFVELAARVNSASLAKPVFLAGEADEAILRELARQGNRVPIVTGLPLIDTARFLAGCAGYVGNDSGITHVAAALGIPVVAIFGPSEPDTWGPRGPNARIVKADERSTESLADIPVERVWEALQDCQGRLESV